MGKMPIDIVMPKLDKLMTQGTITEWYKNDGEEVEEGEVIAD